MNVTVRDTGVTLELAGETLLIDAWGADTIRVQSSMTSELAPVTEALARTAPTVAAVTRHGDEVHVASGGLTAVVQPSGQTSFRRTGSTGTLVGEPCFEPREPPPFPHRRFLDSTGGRRSIEATFQAFPGERIYGLGQHTLGRLDLKGCVVDLSQQNTQIAIPAIVSSRGYGLFWNSPSIGRVEFAENHTRWIAAEAAQLDYFVYRGDDPATILARYCDLTGYALPLPAWTGGFWQSKSFYVSQTELMGAARDHLARGLPLCAMFVDYMHWSNMGDWDWDRELWPAPEEMVRELAESDVRLLVSVWPHVSPRSGNYAELRERGLLVTRDDGSLATFSYADRTAADGIDLALLDLSHPDAQTFLWEHAEASYCRIGVRSFWLDACEPELSGDGRNPREAGVRYHRGRGEAVSGLFPLFFARAFRQGLDAAGDRESVLLARSAWAGSQRYGVVIWSGDTQSTWDSLRAQVSAGLNMMVSGLPWWTSDIGGFFDSDINSEAFRELLVRWFQFAAFWPVMRLHGNRNADFYNAGIFNSGDPNEVWSFGERAYRIICGLLFLRERLRPYLSAQVVVASETGTPPVRPLWFAFPDDAIAVAVDDQFMLGPDLLVAPVLEPGATSRRLYLPHGTAWRDLATGSSRPGGAWVEVPAPLEVTPVFAREGGDLEIDASWFDPIVRAPR